MNDKLNVTDAAATTPGDTKKDTDPSGDCCTVPGGGDPGPGGTPHG